MLKVGITGGIGSGKTTVCRLFELFGIPVYFADDRAKHLMQTDNEVRKALISTFGKAVYTSDGKLDRTGLAQRVFGNDAALRQLEGIVHPAVAKDGERWHSEQTDVPYTLKEAALLIESRSHLLLDRLILVTAPEATRVARVMRRDGVSEAAVRSRMKNQMTDEEKRPHCHFIIENDGQHSLIDQVHGIHKQLKQLYQHPATP